MRLDRWPNIATARGGLVALSKDGWEDNGNTKQMNQKTEENEEKEPWRKSESQRRVGEGPLGVTSGDNMEQKSDKLTASERATTRDQTKRAMKQTVSPIHLGKIIFSNITSAR